jgi:hypothetical protein
MLAGNPSRKIDLYKDIKTERGRRKNRKTEKQNTERQKGRKAERQIGKKTERQTFPLY